MVIKILVQQIYSILKFIFCLSLQLQKALLGLDAPLRFGGDVLFRAVQHADQGAQCLDPVLALGARVRPKVHRVLVGPGYSRLHGKENVRVRILLTARRRRRPDDALEVVQW